MKISYHLWRWLGNSICLSAVLILGYVILQARKGVTLTAGWEWLPEILILSFGVVYLISDILLDRRLIKDGGMDG